MHSFMYVCMHQRTCMYISVYVCITHASICVCMHVSYIHNACMYATIFKNKITLVNFLNGLVRGARISLDPPLVRMHMGNCNATMADSKLFDVLLMKSHEARPSSVSPKLELWGAVNTAVPPVKTLERTVPPCPHDLRHCPHLRWSKELRYYIPGFRLVPNICNVSVAIHVIVALQY